MGALQYNHDIRRLTVYQLWGTSAAILPLVKKDGQPEAGRKIVKMFRDEGINVKYDEAHSIGKRYSRHDEIGTPYCLTVDKQSLEDETVTIRDRDTTEQQRIPIKEALQTVCKRLKGDDQ